jgi:hypothetical protein
VDADVRGACVADPLCSLVDDEPPVSLPAVEGSGGFTKRYRTPIATKATASSTVDVRA